MKLVDYTVQDFTRLLGSQAPAPGGGSASSLVGAQGAALCSMVCSLSIGRKKYEEHQKLILDVKEKSDALTEKFLALIDEDTVAYNKVGDVLGMPRDTDEEKAARKESMQKALKGCTAPPLEMMRVAKEALLLTESLLGKSNLNAVSDLGVGAVCLKAAIQGAWLNVLINVGSIEDREFTEAYIKEGKELLEEVLKKADDVYDQVVEMV